MIGRNVNRFRIVAKLGEGGMGTVWRAEDPSLHRQVALKLPPAEVVGSPRARERFLRGARAASMLDHPGIATIYEVGEYEGGPYIAMALIDGQTVRQRTDQRVLSIDEAVTVGVAAAEALGHAHGRGVIHRDVTGGNIMMSRDGRIFVVDFGLALVRDHARLTSTGNMVGTAAYIAPETLRDEGADSRTDLYGLGVVLYEALTGAPPFRSNTLQALQYQILNQAPELPSALRTELPAWLDRVVLTLLAKRPEERFQNASAFIGALQAGAAGAGKISTMQTADLSRSGNTAGRAPGKPALAVLPFRDVVLGNSPRSEGDEQFAHGLAEVVRASLSRVPDVRVVAPVAWSSMPADGDVRVLARDLGASMVLSGTVRRSGSQIRLTYVLTEVSSNTQLAADNIDSTTANLFALEDQLVASVRDALKVGAGAPGKPRSATRDPAAHQRFLQALGYLQRYEDEASVDKAIDLLEKLLASEGDAAAVNSVVARAYLHKYTLTSELQWADRAAAACETALRLDPHALEVLVTQGELYSATGRQEQAIRSFRMALQLRPDDPEALAGLSLACEETGDFASAEEFCRRVIAVRPGAWSGYNRLGVIFFRQGQYARAAEPWRMVTTLSPDNARGYVNLGAAYFQMGRYDDARVALHRAIAIQPAYATAWTNLGTVHLHSESFQDAAEAFEKAAALKPADPRLWGHLAAACQFIPGREAQKTEALDRAVALMRARLEIQPGSAEDWAWLANWYADLGRRDEAQAALGKATSLAPNDVAATYRIGTAYNLLGDRPNTLHWIGEAVRKGFGAEEVLRDPDFATLREDAEFRDMLARCAVNDSAL